MIGDYRYDPPQGGKDGWYDWLADGPYGAYGKGRGKGKVNVDGPYDGCVRGKGQGKVGDGKTKLLDGFGKGYVIFGKGGKGNNSWTSLPIVNDSSATQWFPGGPMPTIPDQYVDGPGVTVEATLIDGAGHSWSIGISLNINPCWRCDPSP